MDVTIPLVANCPKSDFELVGPGHIDMLWSVEKCLEQLDPHGFDPMRAHGGSRQIYCLRQLKLVYTTPNREECRSGPSVFHLSSLSNFHFFSFNHCIAMTPFLVEVQEAVLDLYTCEFLCDHIGKFKRWLIIHQHVTISIYLKSILSHPWQ